MKTELIDQLAELLQSPDLDILEAQNEVQNIQEQVQKIFDQEDYQASLEALKAVKRGEDPHKAEQRESDPQRDRFFDLLRDWKTRKKEFFDKKKGEEEENMRRKTAVIKRLEDLVQNEENIGKAFGELSALREEWNSIGPAPSSKNAELSKTYSKWLESFHYNINIYKQLKDHDLKVNLTRKQEVLQEMKDLEKVDRIKDLNEELRRLMNEWDAIGGTYPEEWEKIRDEYWEVVRNHQKRIRDHYQGLKEAREENKKKKEALIEEARGHLQDLPSDRAGWNKGADAYKDLQTRWKKTGRAPEGDHDKLWKEFRGVCDEFFNARKEFMKDANKVFDEAREKKQKLVDRAEELKDSTDWKETSNELKNLQKKWKEAGFAGARDDQKLWKKFRAACDHFFNAMQADRDAERNALSANLKAKKEAAEKVCKTEFSGKLDKDTEDLGKVLVEYIECGEVPFRDWFKMQDRISDHLRKQAEALIKDEEERVEWETLMGVELAKSHPEPDRALGDLRSGVRKRINDLEQEVRQFDANKSLFQVSAGAESLFKDAEKRVQAKEAQLEGLKKVIRQIPRK